MQSTDIRGEAHYPQRHPDMKIVPFCSSARESTHIVCLPNGRIFEISEVLHKMLLLMDGTHSQEEIASALNNRLSKEILPSHVNYALEHYFLPHGIVLKAGGEDSDLHKRMAKGPPVKGIVFCPARWLFPITRWLGILFHGPVFCFFLILITLIQIAIMHPSFLHAKKVSSVLLSPHEYVLGYCLLLCGVLFHELGHLSACSYYGCRHGEMRVGFYLIFPVFYSNVTNAWILPRKARIMIDLGGIYFQMLLTIPGACAYWVTGRPLWLYFCMGVLSMGVFALNPFLRFDGYWICSDLLGVPNLRARSRIYLKQLLASLFRKRSPSIEMFVIRRPEKIGLFCYTICSHLFLGAGIGCLLWCIPARMCRLLGSYPALAGRITEAVHQSDMWGLMAAVIQVLLPCVLLAALCRMLWYAIRECAVRVHKRAERYY